MTITYNVGNPGSGFGKAQILSGNGNHIINDKMIPVQSVPITTKVVSLNPVHGEARFNIIWSFLSKTCDILVVFSGYPGFLRQSPRYNWNIVENGVKHHKPTKLTIYNQETSLKQGVSSCRNYGLYYYILEFPLNVAIYCTLNTRQEILTHSFSTILLIKQISIVTRGPGG